MDKKQAIRDHYLDPSKPGSLGGVKSFLQNSKFSDFKYVTDTLHDLKTYSVHKPPKPPGQRRKVVVVGKNMFIAADLADVKIWHPRLNKGTKFLLIIVEIFTKLVSIYPLKNKTGVSVANAFEQHFKKHPEQKNSKLWIDRGKEFISKVTQSVLDKNNVKFYHTFNMKLKSSFAEAFVKLVKLRIARLLEHRGDRKYFDSLPLIEDAMNSEVKQSTGFAPKDIKTYEDESKAWTRQYKSIIESKRKAPKFAVGQKVRIHREKLLFEKVYTTSWSQEIFSIHQIHKYWPIYLYSLIDRNSAEIPLKFYEFELQVVPTDQNDDEIQ